MIRINLLPVKEIRARQRRRREFFVLVGSFVFLVFLLLFLFLQSSSGINSLNSELAELEEQKRLFQQTERRINTLNEQKQALELKLDSILRLRAHSQLPVRVLDEVSRRTPSDKMWIDSLRFSESVLTLSGVGFDNPTIAQYMQRLEESSFFSTANLSNTTQREVGGQKLKTFSLTIGVVVPGEEEQAEETEAAGGS